MERGGREARQPVERAPAHAGEDRGSVSATPPTPAASTAQTLLRLQRAAGNRAAVGWLQRVAVAKKDLGAGALKVDTGGDFDANHLAAGWADAKARSANRNADGIRTNTIVPDAATLTQKVQDADYDTGFVTNGRNRDLRVSGVGVWQIDTAQAKAGSLPAEAPAPTPKTLDLKNGLAADDASKKAKGAYTRTDKGPVFLVTGIRKVT